MTHHGRGRTLSAPGTGSRNKPKRMDTAYVVDPLVPLHERLQYQSHRFRARGMPDLAALLQEAATALSGRPAGSITLTLTPEEADQLNRVLCNGDEIEDLLERLGDAYHAVTGEHLPEPWQIEE